VGGVRGARRVDVRGSPPLESERTHGPDLIAEAVREHDPDQLRSQAGKRAPERAGKWGRYVPRSDPPAVHDVDEVVHCHLVGTGKVEAAVIRPRVERD